MLTITKERVEDIEDIFMVNQEAFKQENEGKLINAIRKSDCFIPELSLVARDDKAIIGHLLLSKILVEKQGERIPILGLAPMCVLPSYQNKGIGSQLVKESLRRSRNLDWKLIAVLGHPDFYSKFGFVPSHTKNIKSPFNVDNKYFMVCELENGAADQMSGGKIVYPDAFNLV